MNRSSANLVVYVACVGALALTSSCAHQGGPRIAAGASSDPFLWLEKITSPEVDAWVSAHNKVSTDQLASDPRYKKIESQMRVILAAHDRIPYPSLRAVKKNGDAMIRNFWTDSEHVRGIWRQTPYSQYLKTDPRWDVILDIDALNKKEGKSWVYESASCLPPEDRDCLVQLSDGGKDEAIVREFDVSTRSFILPSEGGFDLPPAKTRIEWIDADTVFVATDFGPGTLTDSGYPMQIKSWRRRTPLSAARLVFEGKKTDVSVEGSKSFRLESQNIFVSEGLSFFEEKKFIYQDGALSEIPFPATSEFLGDFQNFVFAKLRKDWKTPEKTYSAGSVVSLPIEVIRMADATAHVEVVYEPDAQSTFSGWEAAKNVIFMKTLKNVQSELFALSHQEGAWRMKEIHLPKNGNASVSDASVFDDRFFVSYQSFYVPPSLYAGSADDPSLGLKKVKSLSRKFNSRGLVSEQFEATSADGTRVPYFLVHEKGMKLNRDNPTILNAYGGFEISSEPYYLAGVGKAWLENGGVFALANIRGGGEFGPRWHEAALKENRQRAYDDFAAVALDLFNRNVTSPRRLGIQGWSNGGLLMGAAFTQHPEFYRAVACGGALLDMIRYAKLPPGASWIAEYGDPEDPVMAQAILKYSPYQNVKPGVKYPKVFFETSTEDDRVQPGHVRKMAARMEAYGSSLLFYENTEGGHGAAADINQRVKMKALEFVYFYQQLMN